MKKNSGRKAAQRMFSATACEICGGERNLQRHHINGNPTDNTLGNVSILCQACHAYVHHQTSTWWKGRVKESTCQVCGMNFQPKRSRRAKLCGKKECLAENGRRSAELRWV